MADERGPQRVVLPPNTLVIRQGETSRDIFYWVAGGSVRILVDGASVREIAYAPDVKCFFGDLAALLARPRTSSVETVTENTFLKLPFEPGMIDAFLKASPALAQHWLTSLARSAYDGIDTLKQRQKALDGVQERLRRTELQERTNRKKWSGALFVTEKVYGKSMNGEVGAIHHYLQRLKLFGIEEGKALDIDAKLINAELDKALY